MPRIALSLVLSLTVSPLVWGQMPPRDQAALPPASTQGLEYDVPFFPGETFSDDVATPQSVLGFEVGQRAATHAEIKAVMEAIAATSDRVVVGSHGRTHEGRDLVNLIITSADNHARLEDIQSAMQRLADPRDLSDGDAEALMEDLPAVGFLGYSIHGNETSGADAAMAVVHYLAAGTSEAVTSLLDETVIVIDPMFNPDGRDRYLNHVAQTRQAMPNVDNQSLLRTASWAPGRTNHYLFDLNRDWIFGVHPETRGRIELVSQWHPLLFVDAHEMGPLDTYLFSPPRAPINPFFPQRTAHWGEVFSGDQAAAFDRFGWPYYTGEWNEGWYPGYSDAWAQFRGARGVLYEQARTADDGVMQANGSIRSYRKSVHHQVASSLANLRTLKANRAEMLKDFVEDRRRVVSGSAGFGNQGFAILPTANRGRLRAFTELMTLQGFEMRELTEAATVRGALDQLGNSERRTLPAGTLLLPSDQPEGRLLNAMLSFDPRVPEAALKREREDVIRGEGSSIYDITAWNLSMLYGLPALTLTDDLPGPSRPFELRAVAGPSNLPVDAVAYVIDGASDGSVSAAARLMINGIQVRVAERAFELDGTAFSRGSVVVTASDNRDRGDQVAQQVAQIALEVGEVVQPITSGLGAGDLPDLGGGHFPLLQAPSVAMMGRGSFSIYDFGAIWHFMDQRIGLRHSHINADYTGFFDLRRYNVIILPDTFGELDEAVIQAVTEWVRQGGTLIAVGGAAQGLAANANGEDGFPIATRRLRDAHGALADYQMALEREWLLRDGALPVSDTIWSHGLGEESPIPGKGYEVPSEEEFKHADAWRRQFMPQGAVVAARVDERHWLTFGSRTPLPVLVQDSHVLVAPASVDSALRAGLIDERADDDDEGQQIGWSRLPDDRALNLRMSGLLWPEAGERLANSALVTRERVGQGQVILFSQSPYFRGGTLGTARLLANAIVYGPGFCDSEDLTLLP